MKNRQTSTMKRVWNSATIARAAGTTMTTTTITTTQMRGASG